MATRIEPRRPEPVRTPPPAKTEAKPKTQEKNAAKTQPLEFKTAYEGPKKAGFEKLAGGKALAPAAAPAEAPADPKARAGWWKGLSADQQTQAISADPKKIGSMDGLPASVRDTANRTQLKNELTQLTAEASKGKLSDDKQRQLENAQAVQKQLEKAEQVAGKSQLLVYDSAFVNGEGRAAIVSGDLDTAKNVSVSVPGLSSDVRSYMDNITTDSLNLFKAAGGQQGNVATVAWMGYDAPNFSNVASDNAAEHGATLLAADVAGIRASREGNQPHLTVIGHSYGSTTASIAADRDHLQADDLVLIGSPGTGSAKTVKDYDAQLANGHVWSGSASQDLVTHLNGNNMPGDPLGQDPSEDKFGAQRFTAEAKDRGDHMNIADHSKYYREGSESLANIADIVTGNYGGVDRAKARYDKWEFPRGHVMKDPEADRRV